MHACMCEYVYVFICMYMQEVVCDFCGARYMCVCIYIHMYLCVSIHEVVYVFGGALRYMYAYIQVCIYTFECS